MSYHIELVGGPLCGTILKLDHWTREVRTPIPNPAGWDHSPEPTAIPDDRFPQFARYAYDGGTTSRNLPSYRYVPDWLTPR